MYDWSSSVEKARVKIIEGRYIRIFAHIRINVYIYVYSNVRVSAEVGYCTECTVALINYDVFVS